MDGSATSPPVAKGPKTEILVTLGGLPGNEPGPMTQRTRANAALPQGQDGAQERTLQEQIEAQDARMEVMMNLIESLSAKLEQSSVSVHLAEQPAHDAAPRAAHTATTPRVLGPARTPASGGEGEGGHSAFQNYPMPNTRLGRAFAEVQGWFQWDVVRGTGFFNDHAHGWERHIPTGGPLPVLESFWVARKGRSLSSKAQASMWPVLYDKLPEAKELARSIKPQAICTSIDGFAQIFMETAANTGPAADPPSNTVLWTDRAEWHTEATLVGRALQDLMAHLTLHEILEGQPPEKSLRALFRRCAEALKIDEHARIKDQVLYIVLRFNSLSVS